MTGKILICIENRFIRGIVLKILYERNFEFIEVLDETDLRLKLDIFWDIILFCIIQVDIVSCQKQYEMIKRLKAEGHFPQIPIMAIIPNDSIQMVGGAKKAGIEDVVLIPEKKEMFRESFIQRFVEFIKKIPYEPQKEMTQARRNIVSTLSQDDDLKHEIKRAGRGKYSISFVMGRLTGIQTGMIHDFYGKLKQLLRDTDRILNYDPYTFIVVCPFTVKEFLIEIEKKIRNTFKRMFGNNTRFRRLDMYGVTYPDDDKNIEKLIELLEKGVHDSVIISSIREPLNTLSRERLEEYKKMLKLYK